MALAIASLTEWSDQADISDGQMRLYVKSI